jgi:Flp pilus assembly protein TadD
MLLAGMAAAAQNSQPTGASPGANTTSTAGGEIPPTPAMLTPGVTITGKALHAERPLPKLPPDEFTKCTRQRMGLAEPGESSDHDPAQPDTSQMARMSITTWSCETRIRLEMQVVIDACLNRSGETAPSRIIQACTESLDRDVLPGDQRFFLVASRAGAYFVQGDRRHALDDYSAAIKLAPHSAELYYDRGVVFASQSDEAAALRDFDTAMGIDSKVVVPALLQRAKIYVARRNFSGALADYSEASHLQPTNAVLWSDRGYACLLQHDYNGVIENESVAIGLDANLARAYFFRGAAFGELKDSDNAGSDVNAALRLDPSLDSYLTTKVTSRGKSVSITLPPPP